MEYTVKAVLVHHNRQDAVDGIKQCLCGRAKGGFFGYQLVLLTCLTHPSLPWPVVKLSPSFIQSDMHLGLAPIDLALFHFSFTSVQFNSSPEIYT